MFLKRLTKGLTIKRKSQTDRQPTGFLQNDAVVGDMVQNRTLTANKLLHQYEPFDVVVGSPSQVSSGLASHDNLAQALLDAPSGGSLLILPGTYNENIIIDKKLFIKGQGHSSNVNGTITFTNNSTFSIVKYIRVGDDVTIDVGADGIFFREFYLANGKSVTDNGTANSVGYVEE